jgi:hypothetical protein
VRWTPFLAKSCVGGDNLFLLHRWKRNLNFGDMILSDLVDIPVFQFRRWSKTLGLQKCTEFLSFFESWNLQNSNHLKNTKKIISQQILIWQLINLEENKHKNQFLSNFTSIFLSCMKTSSECRRPVISITYLFSAKIFTSLNFQQILHDFQNMYAVAIWRDII